jgi:hypothetical protein
MKTVSLFIFVFFSFSLLGQENYMALSFGRSFPLGDFAADQSSLENGFAYTGFLAEYSGAYYLRKYIGFGGALKFSDNPINEQAVLDDFTELIPENSTADSALDYNFGQWNIVSMAVGPNISYPLGRIAFEAYFYAGCNIIYPPGMDITADLGADGIFSTSLETKNARFGFDTGLNIRYRLSESAGLKFIVGYQSSSVKGELIQHFSNGQKDIRSDYFCKIQLINAGIGLVYIL